MTPQIGRLRQVGIGKESAAGTAVDAAYWIQVESGSIVPEVEYQEDGGTVGRIEAPFQSEVIKENARTSFSAVARSDWLGALLLSALGSVASETADGESAVYEHTFSVKNDNAHPSFTIIGKDGIATEGSPYSMLNSLTLSCEANGLLMVEAEFVGKQLASDTGTPAYTTDHIWKGSQCTIKLASALSGLSGASAVKFSKFTLTIEKGLVQQPAFGSITLDKNVNTAFRVSGELELLYEAATYRDYVTDGTDRALQISFAGDSIGNAEVCELTIQLAKASFEEFSLTEANDELMVQTLGFKGQFDIDEGTAQMISAVLTNEEASY